MSRTAYSIIPMTRRHVPACAKIVALSEPWRTLREGVDFSPSIARNQAYVCMMGKDIAGFVVFTPEPVFARGGYLRAIGVDPAMRRHGIGRKLLTFAEATTAKKSPNFYLCVSSFNRPAQTFYKKCGYTKAGKLDDLIRKGASEYIFWKRLRDKKVG